MIVLNRIFFFFSSRRRHTRSLCDWSSDVCSSDLVGADPDEIALTTSTTDGLGRVIAGMGLGPGDEIVTSDQEHPGLLGPLLAARRRGVTVKAVPFAHVAEAVGPDTALVAVSHVSWIGGEVVAAGLAELGVPVILDGAQGAGAIHTDPRA